MLRTIQLLCLRKISRYPSPSHRSLRTFTCPLHPSSGTPKPHSAESYFKDADETAPQDPTIHCVDAASEAVQRPYQPPSGQWSQAGVRTSEYEYVSKDEPHDVPNEQANENKLRYDGTEKLYPETSHSGEVQRVNQGEDANQDESP
ncbi:uncharacterized protein BJ212DRAFT_1387599 [Suillus subaureus]|uniref:Uncharacterized protein n=1 Tax=Suillus subaureus TaxID=48587 RepID=A0A9P7J7Y4_9AGAM|nr:uncharacterized protein BJ212DRAFT_1387599 [Suillus subaureus]KAG1807307.1 hypothetical protein BJ212DRAFT_1387599 [Suillus subaureus]